MASLCIKPIARANSVLAKDVRSGLVLIAVQPDLAVARTTFLVELEIFSVGKHAVLVSCGKGLVGISPQSTLALAFLFVQSVAVTTTQDAVSVCDSRVPNSVQQQLAWGIPMIIRFFREVWCWCLWDTGAVLVKVLLMGNVGVFATTKAINAPNCVVTALKTAAGVAAITEVRAYFNK
jgi:hypothetical protein